MQPPPRHVAAGRLSGMWRDIVHYGWRACRETHAGSSLAALRGRASLVLRALLGWPRLVRWHDRPRDSAIAELPRRHPLLPVLRDQPYLHSDWSHGERQHVLETHYRLLDGELACLAMPLDGTWALADLGDCQPGLRLVLDRPCWFRHEGEIALNLFLGEERLYSLLFTVGSRDGRRTAYVGALQGSPSGSVMQVYRDITHAVHGLRPRDLLFSAFRLLCGELGVERILGVSDACSARRSAYFRSAGTPQFSGNAAWVEYGGVAAEDGFFDIPLAVPRRTHAEIPARKRAQYRRRYELLDALAERIGAAVCARQGHLLRDRRMQPAANADWLQRMHCSGLALFAVGHMVDLSHMPL